MPVKEAAEGDEVLPGTVLLAPAGRHLLFRRVGGRVVAHLDLRPLDTPHRPSVDVLFQSAAETSRCTDARRRDDGDGVGWTTGRRVDQGAGRAGADGSRKSPASCMVCLVPSSRPVSSDASVTLERHGGRHPGAVMSATDSRRRRFGPRPEAGAVDSRSRGLRSPRGRGRDVGARALFRLDDPMWSCWISVMKGMYGLDVLAKLREMDQGVEGDRGIRRRADVLAADGERRRRVRVSRQAARG